MYSSRKVEISGVNTYFLPTLSWEQMRPLFVQLASGRVDVREELIQGNLKLVLSVLKRFRNRGENMDDLFQIGCIGLMKAIDNFKLEHNVNFSTYAVPMILGEIKRYLRDNNYIHMSRSTKITAQRVQEVREGLLQKNQREPTVSEVARVMGIGPEDIILACNANMDPISFFEPVFNDSSDPVQIVDLLSDQEEDRRWLENIALKEALDHLEPREKYVLIERFFHGKTQVEVSERLGISQAQISRIEKNALRFLRNFYSSDGKKEK
ncbi:MAG TPA: SigB/SigF/SigG family RNA polymerase sigma factor [Firmicutes bacterium]|jgi:RNA polymerase sporulation-specific sigma factor|nr:SigB/SigF/SigG family RNA polymerase sigma factor [Bacillota bacterium]